MHIKRWIITRSNWLHDSHYRVYTTRWLVGYRQFRWSIYCTRTRITAMIVGLALKSTREWRLTLWQSKHETDEAPSMPNPSAHRTHCDEPLPVACFFILSRRSMSFLERERERNGYERSIATQCLSFPLLVPDAFLFEKFDALRPFENFLNSLHFFITQRLISIRRSRCSCRWRTAEAVGGSCTGTPRCRSTRMERPSRV